MRILTAATDFTAQNNIRAESYVFDEPIVYIGRANRFNSIYFYLETPLEAADSPQVEYWENNEWRPGYTTDYTAGFTRSGEIVIEYSEDDLSMGIADSDEIGLAKGLEDYYWMRLTFAATPTFSIKKIGYALTSKAVMQSIFFKIDSFLGAAGVENWSEQILTVSEQAINHLVAKRKINHREQILRMREWEVTVAHGVLALIFSNLGEEFAERGRASQQIYMQGLNAGGKSIDQDGDGREDRNERRGAITNRMIR